MDNTAHTSGPIVSRAGRLSDAMERAQARAQARDAALQPAVMEPELVPVPTEVDSGAYVDAQLEKLAKSAAEEAVAAQKAATPVVQVEAKRSFFWPGFWLFILGGVCTATAMFTYAWLSAGPTG